MLAPSKFQGCLKLNEFIEIVANFLLLYSFFSRCYCTYA